MSIERGDQEERQGRPTLKCKYEGANLQTWSVKIEARDEFYWFRKTVQIQVIK